MPTDNKMLIWRGLVCASHLFVHYGCVVEKKGNPRTREKNKPTNHGMMQQQLRLCSLFVMGGCFCSILLYDDDDDVYVPGIRG